MHIGILSVKNNRYHPNRRLLEAANTLKHKAILIHPRRIFLGVGDQGLKVGHLSGSLQADVILPRFGSTIREYSVTLVRHLELMGIPVVNNCNAILLARNKFQTLQTLLLKGIPVPETGYASNWLNFERAVYSLGGFPLVIKLPSSRQGRGVLLVDSPGKARDLLDGFLNRGRGLLIQRFMPPEKRRDIRVFVVGKRVIGAMALVPRKGDFRANIHLNARAEKIRLTKVMSDMAIHSAHALGLDISGVDMIEGEKGEIRVIDVNYSPGFKGLERCTGKDVAIEIVKFITHLGKQSLCRSPF